MLHCADYVDASFILLYLAQDHNERLKHFFCWHRATTIVKNRTEKCSEISVFFSKKKSREQCLNVANSPFSAQEK